MDKPKTIGIVGGVGPHAGVDLARKVLEQTRATKDQDHLPLVLFSMPGRVTDRTDFLINGNGKNPAYSLYEIIRQMESVGVEIAGIACNTAHAPIIYDKLMNMLERAGSRVKLLHLIKEVATFIRSYYPRIQKIGVLSTSATVQSGIYTTALMEVGVTPLVPTPNTRWMIDNSIYSLDNGIKVQPWSPSDDAIQALRIGIDELVMQQAEGIVLGCTELPLAISNLQIRSIPVIDSSLVLARALIIEAEPDKLIEYKLLTAINHSL
ncbi:amino acid racemase [Paenibacillus sp. LMG 31461]|uniref:Amino acid racemase n=1 Tax=Paenibacillus plantarum TaxID=2654975 RepID=A0ABX1X4R3_9BACL|nr:amino acid racemase [Paenibacillus plantarum]NOU63257.1 amino acid racemase [Paenibacillus plantarum]